MAAVDSLVSGMRLSKAIQVLHSFMPLFVGGYYFIARILSYFTQRNEEDGKSSRKVLRNVIFWLFVGVPITYTGEAAILFYESLSASGTQRDNIIYVLGSALLWFTLLISFSRSRSYPGYYFYGSWLIYLAGDVMLLSFSLTIGHPKSALAVTTFGIRVLRIVILVLLCGVALGSRFTFSKRSDDEEENTPLLSEDSQFLNNSEGSQLPTGDNSYGSIYPGQETSRPRKSKSPGSSNDPLTGSDGRITNQSIIDYIKSFKILLPLFWPTGQIRLQLLYVGVALCLVANRVLNVVVPLQIGLITNILSKPNTTPPLKEITIFIALRLLDSRGGIEAIRNYLWQPLESYSYKRIGKAAFHKIMTLSSDFHDNKHSGSLWLSISRGQSIRHLVSSVVFQVGPMLVDLALAISVLYYLFDVYMALLIASVVVTFLWSAGRILALQKEKRREWIDNLQKEQNILCESTGNWKTVTYFNRVPYEKSRYYTAMDTHMKSRLISRMWDQMESGVQSFLLISGLMGACLLAAYQVVQGIKPVGSFVMLLSYWAQLSSPLQFFASSFCGAILDLVDAEDLVTLLKRQPTVSNTKDAKHMVLSDGDIEFRDVKFSYDKARDIVKGISFRVPPGKTVALVGETGGGKSTIMKLISRFYDPTEGSVFIDGQDIRHVTLESLRENIGVVPQDPALFHDTIMNNIRYAKFDASDEEIFEACKAVALHEKFLSFADGYETLVGERGVKLSGGELQRVAIARAIVKSPKIVLLDEATSSVDSETEAQIQESLGALSTGRTTFVIAHRLSTISKADNILVIKDGTIVEQGSHEALLKAKGRYYSLWSRQGFFLPESPNQQGTESRQQEESRRMGEPVSNLVDVSEASEGKKKAPSGPNLPGAKDTSVKGSKANKIWKPEAPVFVPCNISRWKPTPAVPESSLEYPALSSRPEKTEVGGADGKLSTLAHNSKENTPDIIVPAISDQGHALTHSHKGKQPVSRDISCAVTSEAMGNELGSPLNAKAMGKDSQDTPRPKRKRINRRNMSKSDPAGANTDNDAGNPSTPSGSKYVPIGELTLESATALGTNGKCNSNPRRRRRSRHLKSKSPRKRLPASNVGADTAPTTPFTPSTEGSQAPRQGPSGVLRFPPVA